MQNTEKREIIIKIERQENSLGALLVQLELYPNPVEYDTGTGEIDTGLVGCFGSDAATKFYDCFLSISYQFAAVRIGPKPSGVR